MRRKPCALGLLVLACVASCSESTGTTPPQTLDDAARRFDAAITQLNWAQQDLWRVGGRDLVVSVQIDSSLAPNYFRLPRQARR